ncbi:hypothetical protein VTO73DRAFT_1589 [Trametes versicolor]
MPPAYGPRLPAAVSSYGDGGGLGRPALSEAHTAKGEERSGTPSCAGQTALCTRGLSIPGWRGCTLRRPWSVTLSIRATMRTYVEKYAQFRSDGRGGGDVDKEMNIDYLNCGLGMGESCRTTGADIRSSVVEGAEGRGGAWQGPLQQPPTMLVSPASPTLDGTRRGNS